MTESLTEEEEIDGVAWMVEGLVRRSQEIPSWEREMRRGREWLRELRLLWRGSLLLLPGLRHSE